MYKCHLQVTLLLLKQFNSSIPYHWQGTVQQNQDVDNLSEASYILVLGQDLNKEETKCKDFRTKC